MSSENKTSISMEEGKVESSDFFVAVQRLKLRRSTLTKTLNKAKQIVNDRVDTEEYYNRAVRLHDSIKAAAKITTEAFEELVSCAKRDNEILKLESQFSRQAEYEENTEDILEELQAKIDAVAAKLDILNGRPSASILSSSLREDAASNENQEVPEDPEAQQHNSSREEGDSDATTEAASTLQAPATPSPQPPSPNHHWSEKDLASKVPKFNGDVTRFEEWWDLFHYYVDSRQIDKTEKCRILKRSLVGQAAKEVCYIKISADLYELMKDSLKSRFGDPEYAQQAHMHQVITTCRARNLARNDKFIEFVTSVSQNVHALVALGSNFASLSPTVAPMILSCIPENYRLKFNESWVDEKEKGSIQLESLIRFLQRQSRNLEQSIKQASFALSENPGSSRPDRNQKFTDRKDSHQGSAKPPYNQRNQFSFAGVVPDPVCIFCAKKHKSFKCQERLSPSDRRKILEEQNACTRCFRRNHSSDKCRVRASNCAKCKGRHNVMVCHREGRSPILGTSPTDITSACQSAPCAGSLGTLLQTAYVWVVNGSKKIICRAILDPGSQRSFVSNKIVKLLNLKPVAQVDLKVHGIAGQVSNNLMNIVQLRLQSRFSDQHIVIGCLQVPTVIEGQIPRAVCPSDLSPLADSREPDFSDVIDVLIGADALHSVYCGMYRRAGEYTASPTIFGWVLWGNGGSNVYTNSVITSCGILQDSMSKSNDLAVYAPSRAKNHSDDLEFLWKTEVLGIENSEANDNRSSLEAMEKFFKDTIKLSPEGRLIVSLPFRENKHTLGDNQKLAYSRLMGLLKNLKKKPSQLKALDDEVAKIVESDFAELAKPRSPTEKAHYLPILAVAKKSLNQEEKIRLVKDGGARSKDEASLNDVLEKGPNYLPDLITVLIQFRRSPIVIVADIKSAFNQFLIDEKHRTFLRFYWPAGISQNPNAPVLEYWAKVLDFGLVCSPWLHCAGVRHHLDLQMVKRPRHADLLAEIKRTFYMDDLAVGCSSLNQGKRLVEFLIEVFREGHFPLGKWKTNSKELAGFIEKITSDDKPEISFENPKAKFLGVSWNQKEDVLFIDTTDTASFFRNNPPTKRNLLKALSQIYDPLGIIASISINFKILTQTLWTRKIDWDAILDPETASEYRRIAGFLDGSDRIAIRRNMFGTASGGSRREIHVFADSSLKAYGAIAYLKETNVNSPSDKCSVSFLMAKARVAPLKGHWTIHRLELMAAVIASRMANHLRNSIPEKIDEIFLYSDNSAVLGWLRSSPEKWKPFVANRVKEILGYSSPDRWSYIQSEENPADLLSRGSALESDSLKQFWLEGSSWLRDNRSQRSHVLNAPSESEEMLREKKVEITAAVASRVQDESTFSSKFSSWAKLVRVTAFMRRWLPKNRNKFKSGDNSITPEEFMEAEIAVVKTIQRQHFAAELDAGASNLSKASALKTLNPFVDDSGILRCRSRLEKSSNINYEVKFPVILPGKDSLVQLLIRSIHETQCLHSGGTAGALHALRQRFLILSARREVNRAIHGCKVCARFKAKAAAEPMPPLPAFRIEESPPFAVTGVDHAGPIYIKNAAGEKTKSYILLFVCAVTRALRLELVADLSTYEFLLALRRFMSRNPSVKHIISDNARTFLKAEKELKSLFEKAKHPDCQSLLSKKGMKWSHSTERAPWHGAFWERLVQVVKRPLRKILGIHALPFRETETLLFEIEKMVNDRPISAVVVDPDEPRALSPSCLLYGYASQPSLPDTKKVLAQSSEATSIVFSERWKRQQAALRSFWKQFQNEYLQHLRSLHYAKFQNSRPIKKGDVCLLHSAEASRAFWPLCIVQEVFGGESTDSRRRSCLIKTSSGQILKRPIQLLYPLEINEF